MSRNAHQAASGRRWLGRLFCLLLLLGLLPHARAQVTHPFANTNSAADAHVVIVEDPDALVNLQPVPARIQSMVDRGITNLTQKANLRAAWSSLVSPKDVVGIKVLSAPGPVSGTRPAVVAAVVQDLIDAGVPRTNIVIWDRRALDLHESGFFELGRRFGVRVQSSVDSGYDRKIFYETPLLGQLAAEDLDFGQKGPGVGRKSYVSKLITRELTKIINITPLLHHNLIGVSGNLFSLAFGSVDNIGRFEDKPEDMSRAVPEICALPITKDDDRLGDRVVLNIVDALICQYEGQYRGLLQYSTVLNQLRFSKDPVALDVLSLQEINAQRERADIPDAKTSVDLYSNATLLEIGVSDPNHIQVEKIP